MNKKINLNKFTSFLVILIMLFQPFQSYVYASGISKITNTIYNSTQNSSKSLKSDKINLNLENGYSQAKAQAPSNNSAVSDAYNYKSLSQTVDPRTGAFSISFKIGNIVGNGFEDPAIPLSLNYSSLSNSDVYSLGKGWSWNLTHYDTKSGMLILGSGGSYKLDIGTGRLKYYKIKDLIVSLSNNLITLKYKDGHIEQIDRTFGNLIKYINVEGYSATLNYEMGSRLQSIVYKNIYDDSEIKKLEINYPSNYEVWIQRIIGPNEKATTMIKKSKDNLLTSINDALGQEIKFSYKALPEREMNTDSLITDILYPTGTSINIIYLVGGLNSAKKGFSAPAVSKIKTISLPRSDNNIEEIIYSYYESTKTNYLAYGFTGYKEGEDTLFFTPNSYTYSTIERKNGPNNKTITTERVYNHFHQLLKEILKVNGEYFQVKEYIYPDWNNKSFDSLDENYNFPKEVRLTYYSNGNRRTEITKQEYDSNGNIIKTQDVSGIVKEYFYLDSEKTFNKIKHLPLREIEYSINGGGYKIIDYIYEQANNYQGNLIQRLRAKINKLSQNLCDISDKNCGTIYKIETHSYDKSSGIATFALPTSTKLFALSNKRCKVIQKKQEYNINQYTNQFTRNLLSKDGNLLAKEVSVLNSYTNLEEKSLDPKGIEASYKYDVLGRKILEVNKPISSSTELKTVYTFKINDTNFGGYGTSSMIVQKSNGYKIAVVYDSLGRELEKYALNNNGNMNKIKSYSYGIVGQKIRETIYNNDQNGNLFQYSINYKYDILGREIQMISPSSETKVTKYDDVNLTQESFVLAADGELSPISIVTLNENKKPIKAQLLKSNRNLYSQSFKKYDNYGNLLESIDINGNKTSYNYNLLGQKLEDIFSDGRRIKYEYDPIFESKVTKKTVVVKNGTEYVLGTNEYNLLGQILSYKDMSGNIIKYEYDKKGNLINQNRNSAKEIKYAYNSLNQLYKKEVSNDFSGKYSSTYLYDDKNQKLILMRDSTGETKYSYNIDGSLKSVIYPDDRKISYDYDMQGAIILITDILGNKTIYNYSKSNAKLESSKFISSITNENQVEKYFYDKYGRIYYKLSPNDAKTIYEYNELNGLKKLTHFVRDKQTLSYSFTYYKDLNIASRVRTGESGSNTIANESYTYDTLNNLLSYFCNGNLCPKDQNKNTIISEEYSFDGLNNIRTAKVVFSDTQTSLTTYHYLNKDPLKISGYSIISPKINKSYTIDYDNEGNVIKDGDGNLFIYSPFNRMEKFISNGKETEYFYNGSGALVSQKTAISNEESRFYYNGARVLNEISNGNLISYFQVSGRIIGKKIDGKNFQLFLTDQAHSVIRILEGNTLLDIELAYTPYGQSSDVSKKSSILKLSNIGFNGERTDSKTGFQFLGQGYRAYNPGLGRFMQHDVNSPFGKGGINGYIFAENNPIMKFDSSGESAASYAVMGVGILLAIVGIVASVFSFGSTLSLTAVGGTLTTSATTTQIALATTSLVTGVASGATGIASSIYSHKAEMALEVGDKSLAESYANTASALGWASLALGIVSAVSGIACSLSSAKVLSNEIPLDEAADRYGRISIRVNEEKYAYFQKYENTDNFSSKIYRNKDIYDKVSKLQDIADTPFRGKTFDAQRILYYMRAYTIGTDEEIGRYSATAYFKASKIEQLDVIRNSNFHETDPFFNKFMDIFNKSQTFDEYFDYYQEALTTVRNNL